jgi:hypothetical protein
MADLECQDGVGRASAEGVGVGEDAGLEMEMEMEMIKILTLQHQSGLAPWSKRRHLAVSRERENS